MKIWICVSLIMVTCRAYALDNAFKYSIKKNNISIDVKADGTYQEITDQQFYIAIPSAKDHFSKYTLRYDKSTSNFEILSAFVESRNKTQHVAKDYIVDKSVATDVRGFESINEVMIAFTGIEHHSKINLKTKKNVHTIPVKGHFSYEGTIGVNQKDEAVLVDITSDLPLSYQVNDPGKILKIDSKKNKDGRYSLTIKQTSPISLSVGSNGVIPRVEDFTYYAISTDKTWDKLGQELNRKFEDKVSTPDVSMFTEWLMKAGKKEKVSEKVNIILRMMNEKYTYLGDWRTVEGKFFPRDVKDIHSSSYGDCKDYATVLSVLLRHLGLNPKIALVRRSSYMEALLQAPKSEVVSLGEFNHAIVHFNHDGIDYWIDPTAKNIPFGFVDQDIAGKNALVLDEKPHLKRIQILNSNDSKLKLSKTYDYKSAKDINVKVELELFGQIRFEIYRLIKEFDDAQQKNLIHQIFKYGDKSGIVNFLPFQFDLKESSSVKINWTYTTEVNESEGKYLFTTPDVGHHEQLMKGLNSFSGLLFLGLPSEIERKFVFNGVSASGSFPQSCSVSSMWYDGERRYELAGEGISFTEKSILKTGIINSHETKNPTFKMFADKFGDCFKSKDIHYQIGSGKHATHSIDLEKLFSDLPVEKRIVNRKNLVRDHLSRYGRKQASIYNISELIKLMKINLSESVEDVETYYLLAELIKKDGYYNARNWSGDSLSEALQIISQGLRIAPSNTLLKASLANLLALSRRTTEAGEIYKGSLHGYDVTNFDEIMILVSLTRGLRFFEDGIKYLDEAMKIAANDIQRSEVFFVRSVLALEMRDYPTCISELTKAIEIDDTFIWAYINLSTCQKMTESYQQSVENAERAYKLVPVGMAKTALIEALKSRSQNYRNQGKFDLAQNDLQRLVTLSPESDFYVGLASTYAEMNETDRADEVIAQGAVYASDDLSDYYYQLANNYDSKRTRYDEFIAKAIETANDEQKIKIYNSYIKRLNYEGKREKSLEYTKKLISLFETKFENHKLDHIFLIQYASVLYSVSKVDGDIEKLALARELLEKATELESGLAQATIMISEIDKSFETIGRKSDSVMWELKVTLHQNLIKYLDYRLMQW